MTELTLEGDSTQVEVSSSLVKVISVVLMALGLVCAVYLLNWTVENKLAKSEQVESSQITAELRERQLGCLAKNIYYEAGGEPFEGKVAVAQVTLNRANSSQFPGDICKVVYQKNIVYEKVLCQFSWVCDRDTAVKPKHPAAYRESMEVAKKVLLEGFELPGLKDAMYFHGDYINPGWKREKVAKIGRHIFYK
jgi:spore germination cell wall hydrolase CwlJ-like protein